MKKFFSRILGADSIIPPRGNLVFHPAETCPECGTKLARGEFAGEPAEWQCPNLDCPAQVRARIEHWCSPEALAIAGADAALIKQLVTAGLVRDVAELYAVRPAEIAGLPGRDEAYGKKMIEAVVGSKSQEAWRVLFGLKIPDVDAATAERLCQKFSALDDILAAGSERLQKLSGVDEKIARSIANWYSDGVNRRLVRRLQKANLNFKCQDSA